MNFRKVFGACLSGAGAAAGAAATLAFWTLWLVLAVGIVFQLHVASTRELAVPDFVRRAIEERLALSGIGVSFGRTVFDPSGRILVEDVRLTLPGCEDPLVTARSVYVQLDPWALAARRFEPVEVRATGATLRIPPQLSASGGADEIVSDLDTAIRPRAREITIDYLNARVGNLAVSARGTVLLGTAAGGGRVPLPAAEFLARHYADFSRACAGALEMFGALDRPALTAELNPSETAGAWVRLELIARGLNLPAPAFLRASDLRAVARVPLFGERPFEGQVAVSVGAAQAAGAVPVVLRDVRLLAQLAIGGEGSRRKVVLQRIEASAAEASAGGLVLRFPMLSAQGPGLGGLASPSGGAGQMQGRALAWLWERPFAVSANANLDLKSATASFQGLIDPEAVGFVGARIKRNLGRFLSLKAPVAIAGEARFGPGWRFAGASADLTAEEVIARGVTIDEARGRLEFNGRRLVSPEAYARVGENFAYGSFEQGAGRMYRFLLRGRLRPLDIAPWIIGKWWTEVFGRMAFPVAPPEASVDLRGCWTDGRQAAAFVSVDSDHPVIRGLALDRVRARLFAKPDLTEGWDILAARGDGSISGTFSRRYDLKAASWRSLDFDMASTLDVLPLAKALGPAGEAGLAPFAFDKAPDLRISGHLDGPAAPGGPGQALHIEARADGPFRYHEFPFERVAFTAEVRNGDITIAPIAAGFAGGRLAGRARVWGQGADRRLSAAGSLAGANLRQAIAALNMYSASRNKRAPPSLGQFVREKADIRLDVSVSAEGRFDDPFSFQGVGAAQVSGPDLGNVRMLGLLSELLSFTSLRFTSANADFQIKGNRLDFPRLAVSGANSGIDASGTYFLDSHRLDFKARINPLKESKGLPQEVINAVLTPISNVLEVSLTGSVESPRWAFVNSPANLLRPKADDAEAPKPAAPAR